LTIVFFVVRPVWT